MMAAQIYNFVCLVFILGQKCHFVHARVANVACQEVKYKYSAKVDGYDNPLVPESGKLEFVFLQKFPTIRFVFQCIFQ